MLLGFAPKSELSVKRTRLLKNSPCDRFLRVIPFAALQGGSWAMMGRLSGWVALSSEFRLEDHVPADHLLRRVDAALDFGFVHTCSGAQS